MKTRKWNIWLTAILLTTLMITGYFAIAAEYGSKDDPLVTLSYINDVLTPQTISKIDAALAEKQKTFDAQVDAKVAAANKAMDDKAAAYQSALASGGITDEMVNTIADKVIAKLGTAGTGGATAAKSSWAVVKIPAGKTAVCEVGCEIVLRLNSATCYASGSPGLVDVSDGTTLENGGALTANHLYLVTIQGRGFKTAAGCTVLISGSYTLK